MSQETLLKVLLSPRVSDKAYRIADQANQVAFKVATWATKPQIKKAVESLFEVEVTGVTTANAKGKARRFGRIEGKTKAWKKAYVTLKEGQEINFVDAD